MDQDGLMFYMRYFSCKNEDGRANAFSSLFCKNKICADSTQHWYVFTLFKGVPLVGVMDFYGGESMPMGSGQLSPFPGESLPLGFLPFYFR